MRARTFLAGVLLLTLLLAATGGGRAAVQPEQEKKEGAQAELPKPLVIPEEDRNRKNPVPANEESVETGRKLYSSQCALCHGEKGDGKGDLAADMKLAVPDFTTEEWKKKRTDGEWFYILSLGHGSMPAQGDRLREIQRWHLVNYLRTLASGGAEKPKSSEKH
jgi:mono/diheme cytochrome c family protein